jgi:hypothetical protein
MLSSGYILNYFTAAANVALRSRGVDDIPVRTYYFGCVCGSAHHGVHFVVEFNKLGLSNKRNNQKGK